MTLPPPPRLADLPAGTVLVAGMGVSTVLADLDFETYSEAGYVWDAARSRWGGPPRAPKGKRGIGAVGAPQYARHPSTEIISLAYDLKDGRGRRHWRPGQEPPLDLFLHITAGRLLEAWNVAFEREIWEHVAVPRLGWPPVRREQWRCAMAKARAFGLPGSLGQAGAVINAGTQKDPRGRALLTRFSVPRNPTKADPRLRIPVEGDPQGPEFYAYNVRDIEAEAEISSLTPDLQPDEFEWWQVDQIINARGLHVDMASVNGALAILDQALARYNGEIRLLTGGAVGATTEVQALLGWLHGMGVRSDNLDEEAVETLLTDDGLPPAARRALELRALAASASVKKLAAISTQVGADNRLRDLFTYHGARTGRTTGNGAQPTNLPKAGPHLRRCEQCRRHYGEAKPACPWCGGAGPVEAWSPGAADDALEVARAGSLDLFDAVYDGALATLSGCLRGCFTAAPGHDLIASDYSAIEAVVLAALAGEEWRLEVFRTGQDIYLHSASKITGVTVDEMKRHKADIGQHHPLRSKVGKVAELASGYQGWTGAWRAFGADDFFSDENDLKRAILAWRDASPRIVEFWGGQRRKIGYDHWRDEPYGMEGAAVTAVRRPGAVQVCRGHEWVMRGDVLYCRLLSGRYLTYHRPRLTPSDRRPGEELLSYETWNTNPKYGQVGWVRMPTWGGRLVENVTQATARDWQRQALVAHERAGYHIVLHVYDENVAEVPEGWGTVEEFEQIMSTPPPWGVGWPIVARGGWRGKRYRKD